MLLKIWSCLSRSAASPIICVLISYLSLNFWIRHSASSLEVLTGTSSPWTEALIHRASSEYKHVLACPQRKPISSKKPPSSHSQFEQRHGCRTNSFSTNHTVDCLVLLRLLPEATMETLRLALAEKYAHRTSITIRTVPFWLLDAASEMTSFTPC